MNKTAFIRDIRFFFFKSYYLQKNSYPKLSQMDTI